jgi:beta-phosphoglucomutase-like phosphatase (HAD superfamily)
MARSAIFFGSIGAVAETSDIQRQAYNQALREAGLTWHWDREIYSGLLQQSGGLDRLSQLAAATGTALSAEQVETIHARKTELARQHIRDNGISLRPGVEALMKYARDQRFHRAFVTTTYTPNIEAIFEGSRGALSAADFDLIVSRNDVQRGKPAPDAYLTALSALSIEASSALAIEDTANSLLSAKRAGLTVVATPGALTGNQDFWQADLLIDALASPDGTIDRRVLSLLG